MAKPIYSKKTSDFLDGLKRGDDKNRMLTPQEIECLRVLAIEISDGVRKSLRNCKPHNINVE